MPRYTGRNVVSPGPNYEALADELMQDVFAASEGLKQQIDAAIEGRLTITQEFVDRLNFTYGDDKWGDMMGLLTKGTKDNVRSQLNQINTRLGNVLAANLDVDHVDITYVNTRTVLIINLLEGALIEVESGFTDDATDRFLGQVAGNSRDPSVLREIIQSLKKNLAFSERISAKLEAYDAKSTSGGLSSEPGLVDAVLAELEEEVVVEIDKQKYVDALDGKVEAKFALKTPTFNRDAKGRIQRVLGKQRQAALRNYEETLTEAEQTFVNKIQNAAFEVTGSDPVLKDLVNQLEAKFRNKMTKLKKSSSKKTVKKTPTKSKVRAKRKRFDSKLSEMQRLIAGAQARTAIDSRAKTRKDVSVQRQLNELRITINRLLPAKVKQNMGRPALENRTGRFANSVRLETLVKGRQTIIGEYSYMYAPYETFEDGSRWPLGYNPKPLITKSIRELATKQLAQKFTLRKM